MEVQFGNLDKWNYNLDIYTNVRGVGTKKEEKKDKKSI